MPVKEKSRQQLTALSEPLLEPGDRILHMVVAQVGKPPVAQNVAAVALSIAAALVASALGSSTAMAGFFVKGHAYFVVTDRRLLIFAGRRNRRGPGRLLGNVPRHAVTLTRVTDGLTHKIRFRIDGSSEEVRLHFPPLNRGARRDARDLVTLLGGPPHSVPVHGRGESRRAPQGSGGGHRAAGGRRLGAMFSGLSWWQVVLVLLPFSLAGIGGALGGLVGGAGAGANMTLARRRRHGAALTALSMICVDALVGGVYFGGAAVLLSKPAPTSQATPTVTPTTQGTPHILPPGPDFTPAATWAPQPPGVALNAPSVLRSTGAALSWPAYVNTSGSAAYDITAYKVYRSPSISFIQSQTTLVASLAPGITSFVDGTTDNPYGGGLYYYMVAVRTRSGVVINGTPLPVELPAAGQTQIFIPAVASGTLSAAYPNTVAVAGDGSHQPRVEVGALGGLGATRAVFGFGALNDALPSGAVVVEAHLSLRDNETSPLDVRGTYVLYELSRSFTASQATWNSAAPGIPWTKPGGDYTTAPAGTALPQDEADPFSWDFDATAIVRGWISDPGSEHGLLLRENYETDPHQMVYFSSVGARIPPGQRPELVITYTV